jgi:hypothetical protein
MGNERGKSGDERERDAWDGEKWGKKGEIEGW